VIEKYQNAFARLRIDRSRDRYPALTNDAAPHKLFLLLSIIDLIAQKKITENFIEPSFELVDTWNGYWNAIMPIGHRSSMAYPFPLFGLS
jgi:putative restriction endonuclease